MAKLVECPNCLGTGELINNKMRVVTCHTCQGDSVVDEVIASGFINETGEIYEGEFNTE